METTIIPRVLNDGKWKTGFQVPNDTDVDQVVNMIFRKGSVKKYKELKIEPYSSKSFFFEEKGAWIAEIQHNRGVYPDGILFDTKTGAFQFIPGKKKL